jgi:hydroxylamine dehydrogenase
VRHACLSLQILLLVIFLPASAMAAEWDGLAPAGRCMPCHKEKTPGLYRQWYNSQHAVHNVTCIDCHMASKGEPDAFEHEGALIATLVTPGDCGRCHETEAREVGNSHHAKAGKILDSADAYLAHVTAGHPVAILGCESCHGAKMEIDPGSPNKLSKTTWPNSGIGRINPDGSLGSCNACHVRHGFSKKQARQPESCSKCHLGPDHPQKEVYEESKHGNTYYTNVGEMNLEADSWVVGVDYYVAPTCSTCHMSATANQKVSHDVGNRLAWTLRPPVSKRQDNWKVKRGNMKDVCSTCHGQVWADGFFHQFDATVRLYDEKFAKPAGVIMQLVRKNGLLENRASFSNDIEWIYWELWHHEGRRARHGASMMGPDYAWWHGFYEVAKHFYFDFLPAAREYENEEVNAYIDKLLGDPMHDWMSRETEDLKEAIRSGELKELYREFFVEE